MTRLGLTHDDASLLAADSMLRQTLNLKLVMTHLSCANELDHPLNEQQLERFARTRMLFPRAESSIAASAGIFLGSRWHGDWTRPGAALYGIAPQLGARNPMARVVRLEAKIIQVQTVDAGTPVSYGSSYYTARRATLATAAIGYADGLPRALSNQGCGYIDGARVPIVGRVTMDLTVFDATDLPSDSVIPGKFIELIGERQTVDDVAEIAGTIGYEIISRLGRRIHRRYLMEPRCRIVGARRSPAVLSREN
jgi:alanine racemase